MGKIQVNDPIRPRELTMIQGEQITVPVRNSVHTFSSVDLRAAQAAIYICGPSQNGTMKSLAPASAKSSCSTVHFNMCSFGPVTLNRPNVRSTLILRSETRMEFS